MSDQEIKVDEDLPNFFDTIKLSSANEIIKEVENMEENFGFEHNDPDTIDNLERCKNTFPVKEIQGTPWYQILSNPSYVAQFNYIGAFVGEREKLIEDGYHDDYVDKEETEMTADCKRARHEQSDMVMILLNLAYIPDSVVKQIDFKPGWQKKFKAAMDNYKQEFWSTHNKPW